MLQEHKHNKKSLELARDSKPEFIKRIEVLTKTNKKREIKLIKCYLL